MENPLKNPASFDLKLLAYKIFAFDEPMTKWQAIQKIWSRLCSKSNSDSSTIGNWQNLSHLSVHWSEQSKHLWQSFVRSFAIEEVSRFEPAALVDWARRSDLARINKRPNALSLSEVNSFQAASAWIDFIESLAPAISAVFESDHESAIFQLARSFVETCLTTKQKVEQKPFDNLSDTKNNFAQKLFLNQVSAHKTALPDSFLPDYVVLVEGPTEAILLPALAQQLDIPLAGAWIVPAGGAQQVLKKYLRFKTVFRMPLYAVLDRDATVQWHSLKSNLRKQDQVYILKEGEVEELLKPDFFVLLLNSYIDTLNMIGSEKSCVSIKDITDFPSRKMALDKLWRDSKLSRFGYFDKVAFANFVAQTLPNLSANGGLDWLTEDGKLLLNEIASLKQL